MPNDPVTDLEIDAYVDHELDLARRVAVEEYLAQHPRQAARVMGDLQLRSALRLAQADLPDAPTLDALARRVGTRLGKRHGILAQLFTPFRLTATVAAAIVAGVVAFTALPGPAAAQPPDFVEDAAESFRTGLLRAGMTSQLEMRRFDPRDIQRSTRIRVPTLPQSWRITDVQIFPSDDGPALQVMARTGTGGMVSVFAVRTRAAAPRRPVAVRQGDTSVAYWRNGDMAYALAGPAAPAALDVVAEDLADNRLS